MSKEVKSFSIGSIALAIFALMRNLLPLSNMEFFVAACAFSVITAIFSYYIMNKSISQSKPIIDQIWAVAIIVLFMIWIALFYLNETNAEHPLDESALIRSYFSFPVWISITIIGVIFCLFLLRKSPNAKILKVRKIIRFITSLLFTFGVSIQFYAPNIFQDIQGGTYHSHAYTNSIINVCWMIPYSKNMESLYGHYAILYMPVLKFLHKFLHVNYLTGIFIVSAVIAGISILLFLYVLNNLAKNDLIFYLGMLAIGEYYFMLMQGGVYLQVHPHRMIFPILLTVLALQEQKTEKKHNIIAVCFITLSFVWSTEVGIVIMLSFSFYRWVQAAMDESSFSLRKVLLLIRELLIYALLPFILAYVIICCYNLLAGGTVLDFREFMFPLISDRNYIENIELPLPDASHAWLGATVLFLGTVIPAIFQLLFPSHAEKKANTFYFFLGVMSLGLMLYYINRPVEGSMFIIMFLMLILQVSILQKCQDHYIEWKTRKEPVTAAPNRLLLTFLRIITTLILFIMAFDSVYSMPKAWKTSSETIWKMDELKEFAEYVWVQIPPDAISFGEGVPELMALIDRDTHLHSTEWSYLNMPLDTMEWARNELENAEWFFCSSYSLWYLQTYYPGLSDKFYLHEQFEYNGAEFAFFRANP